MERAVKESMIIGKLRIATGENEGYKRLESDVVVGEKKTTLWFQYPVRYEEYICFERSDAFVVSLLPYAMKRGLDIVCDNPLSERLMYQLENYYIPILSKNHKEFYSIRIHAGMDSTNYNIASGVATGCSCGVDSFFSVLYHNYGEHVPAAYQLTHLISMNVGSFGVDGKEESRLWFHKELEKARKVAEQLTLELIDVDSNLQSFYVENHGSSGTVRMAGAVLGLQKLIKTYYISAGFDLTGFDITSPENDDYDLFNLSCVSNEGTVFYSSGSEVSRYERTEYLSNYPITYSTLTVCLMGVNNCGVCEKCLRTMATLYAIDKLNLYAESFDVERFYRHRTYYLAKVRCFGIGYLFPLYKEIYVQLKKKHPVYYWFITVMAYTIMYPILRARNIVKKVLPEELKQKIKKFLARE